MPADRRTISSLPSHAIISFLVSRRHAHALRQAVCHHGTPSASIAILLAAVVTNHVQRVLGPQLGHFRGIPTLETMKLAKSSPHHFLLESVQFRWSAECIWLLELAGFRAVTRYALAQIVHSQRHDKRTVLLTILYCAASLTFLELGYSQTCWAAAHLYALARLRLWRSGLGWEVLGQLLREHPAQGAIQAVTLAHWIGTRLVPTGRRVRDSTWEGALGLLVFHGVVWGGTGYVVSRSNRFFIWLEVRDMLVTFTWMGLGIVMVLLWKVDDLWLQAYTVRLQKASRSGQIDQQGT